MKKTGSLLLGSILLLLACRQKEIIHTKQGPDFSYFELSYKGGWSGDLSFCVDSNRIFFFPELYQHEDHNKVSYGLLPDSLYRAIDTFTQAMRSMHSLNPDSTYCYDCDEISVKAIINNDTIRLFQAGEMNGRAWQLIQRLRNFKKTNRSTQFFVAYFFLETMHDVMPPLPPPIEPPKD